MKAHAALALALLTSGCYRSHERADADAALPLADAGPSPRVAHVSVDGELGCAIGDDARVRCWGQFTGFVGSAEHQLPASPTLVEGLEDVVALSVSMDHVCAVEADGSVWCWGENTLAQLGQPIDLDGGPSFHALPMRVPGLAPARSVAVGWLHSCALLESGGVACWGDNGLGGLPVAGAGGGSDVPVIAPALEDVVQLEAYTTTTCARTREGAVHCWGANAFGETGPLDGVRVHRLDVAPVIDVFPSDTVSHALAADGTVFAWGAPSGTVPGDGSVRTVGSLPRAVRLVSSYPRVCAVDVDGVVDCLPSSDGAFGVDAFDALIRALPPAREVDIAWQFACVVDLEGAVACAGQNGAGELGRGTRGDRLATDARVVLSDARRVVRGADFACALASHRVLCWGGNVWGDLGIDAPVEAPSPAPVSLPLDDVTAIDARAYHACAVAGGDVYCWGHSAHGEVVAGVEAVVRATRIALEGTATDVAVGELHVCALTSAGVFCWGADDRGQVGSDAFLFAMPPTRIVLPAAAVAIAAGDLHTCAALADGDVWCWGDDWDGQMGEEGRCSETCEARFRSGDIEHAHAQDVPLRVPGVTGATELEAVGGTTCASGGDGTFCWPVLGGVVHRDAPVLLGDRGLGCEGTPLVCAPLDGTASEPVPVPVPTMTGVRDVALDSWTGCAIDGVGDLRCWGAGGRGELGTGDGYGTVAEPLHW